MKNIILGAGMTGLAAGYKTGYPIYEMSAHAGGICRSYRKDGFEFACGGGHWLFENEKTKEAMDLVKSIVELKSYERRAGIYYNKIFPYPIQTFSEKPNISTPGFFKDWMSKKFSNEMCNMFFFPFNEKYTCGLMDEIVQFDSYKTPPAGSVGFVSKFYDPVEGLSSLVDKMASTCEIHYNKKVIKVSPQEKIVIFVDGEAVKYDNLISTIPLDNLLNMCGEWGFDLPYTSVLVINIGAEPDINLPKEHWLYIPFCKSGFYRIGIYTNVDSNKAPEGKVSLSVEMAFRGVEFDDLDLDYINYHVIKELQEWRFIKDVITVDPTWVKTAYTWMKTLEERERHLEWLKSKDILSIGRYGKWKFQGILESIMDGLSL